MFLANLNDGNVDHAFRIARWFISARRDAEGRAHGTNSQHQTDTPSQPVIHGIHDLPPKRVMLYFKQLSGGSHVEARRGMRNWYIMCPGRFDGGKDEIT